MTIRRSAALAGPVLLVLVVVACADGTIGGAEGAGDLDAGSVEASTLGEPRDSGADTRDAKEEEEDASTVDPACVTALGEATFDFEASTQGWTSRTSDGATGTWPFDPWTHGSATALPCPSGKCWGAERTQNYAQCQRGELVSPTIDLSACADETVVLQFTHAYAFWTGSYDGQTWFDGGIVEISKDGGSSWKVPTASYPGTVKINPDRGGSYKCLLEDQFHVHGEAGFTATQATAETFEIEIPADYLDDQFRVRFSQASGVSSQTTDANASRSATAAGWRIDDVKLVLAE